MVWSFLFGGVLAENGCDLRSEFLDFGKVEIEVGGIDEDLIEIAEAL